MFPFESSRRLDLRGTIARVGVVPRGLLFDEARANGRLDEFAAIAEPPASDGVPHVVLIDGTESRAIIFEYEGGVFDEVAARAVRSLTERLNAIS